MKKLLLTFILLFNFNLANATTPAERAEEIKAFIENDFGGKGLPQLYLNYYKSNYLVGNLFKLALQAQHSPDESIKRFSNEITKGFYGKISYDDIKTSTDGEYGVVTITNFISETTDKNIPDFVMQMQYPKVTIKARKDNYKISMGEEYIMASNFNFMDMIRSGADIDDIETEKRFINDTLTPFLIVKQDADNSLDILLKDGKIIKETWQINNSNIIDGKSGVSYATIDRLNYITSSSVNDSNELSKFDMSMSGIKLGDSLKLITGATGKADIIFKLRYDLDRASFDDMFEFLSQRISKGDAVVNPMAHVQNNLDNTYAQIDAELNGTKYETKTIENKEILRAKAQKLKGKFFIDELTINTTDSGNAKLNWLVDLDGNSNINQTGKLEVTNYRGFTDYLRKSFFAPQDEMDAVIAKLEQLSSTKDGTLTYDVNIKNDDVDINGLSAEEFDNAFDGI